MRKLLRRIARYRMKQEGIQHMNKRMGRGCSFFAERWREYV